MGRGGDATAAPPVPPPGSLGAGEYHWSKEEEPHVGRRKAILAAHPEIRDLFGPDPAMVPQVVATVGLQLFMAHWATTQPAWLFAASAYFVGGLASHNLFLANHELCHNLAFEHPALNRMAGIFANLPICIPFSSSFPKYHLEHHRFQGYHGVDMDVPTYAEGNVVTHNMHKLVWVVCQLFFYALRPTICKPKPIGFWDVANLGAIAAFDYWAYTTLGGKAVLWLLLAAFLGGGLHPVAGHFIAEHYVMEPGQETYSYYGPLNWVTYNVGYHNEHHDFPRIPGSRLPKVRAIAPEFYDNLKHYDSWWYSIHAYITDSTLGPFSRMMRFRDGKPKGL